MSVEVSLGVTKLGGRGGALTFGYLYREAFLLGLTSNGFLYSAFSIDHSKC